MSDEFEVWDGTKWKYSTWNYGVPVFMTTSNQNSGVTDDNLWIRATLNEDNPEGRWFQTARIHSKTRIGYPMYTEARIKTAHISAYNTYWLNNGNSTNRNEIDIIENNSKPSNTNPEDAVRPYEMYSQYFHVVDGDTKRDKGHFDSRDLHAANPLKDVKWNEAYHTYGVWWKDARNIQFYLNGEPAGSVVSERDFTLDLEIIFDLWTEDVRWVGGLPPKSDLSNNSINTMKIDWVRTWKLADKAE